MSSNLVGIFSSTVNVFPVSTLHFIAMAVYDDVRMSSTAFTSSARENELLFFIDIADNCFWPVAALLHTCQFFTWLINKNVHVHHWIWSKTLVAWVTIVSPNLRHGLPVKNWLLFVEIQYIVSLAHSMCTSVDEGLLYSCLRKINSFISQYCWGTICWSNHIMVFISSVVQVMDWLS